MPGLAGAGGGSDAIRAGKAFVEISAQDKGIQATIDKLKKKFTTFGAGVRNIGLGIAAVGVAALSPLVGAADTLIDLGKIQDVADAFGITGKAASGLFGLLEAAGGEFKENLEGIIQFSGTMEKAFQGIGQGAELFDGLNIKAEELKGLAVDEQFYRVLGAIRQLPQPLQESKLALLGGTDSMKQWQKLLTMSEADARALAEELSISNEELRQASDTARKYERTTLMIRRGWQEIVLALAPAIEQILTAIMPVIQGIMKFIANNHQLVVTLAGVAVGLVVAGLAIAALGVGIMAVGGIITAVTTTIGGISAALVFLATPVGAVIAVVVLLGLAFVAVGAILTYVFWDEIMAVFTAISTWFTTTFAESIAAFTQMWEGLAAALKKGDLKLAMAIVVTGIQVVWFDMLTQMKNMFVTFLKWFIDKLVSIPQVIGSVFGKIPGLEEASAILKGIGDQAKLLISVGDAAISTALKTELDKAKQDLAMLVNFAKGEEKKLAPEKVPNTSGYKTAVAVAGQRGSFSADNARQRFAQGESFEKRQEKLQKEIADNTKRGANAAEDLNKKMVLQ